MGQGALSKPAVQWWLSLNSSMAHFCIRAKKPSRPFKSSNAQETLHITHRELYNFCSLLQTW